MAISPPKKRLILISLSATNLETPTEVALLILITRHLFCFTDRLRLTQVIKSNRKRLCLLDFRELSSRTTQIHRERTTSGTPKETLTWISFPSWLGCLESYQSLILKCQNTLTFSAVQLKSPTQPPQHCNAQLQSGGSHADASPSSTLPTSLLLLKIMTSWLQNYFSFSLLIHSVTLLRNKALSLHIWFDKVITWMIL